MCFLGVGLPALGTVAPGVTVLDRWGLEPCERVELSRVPAGGERSFGHCGNFPLEFTFLPGLAGIRIMRLGRRVRWSGSRESTVK